MSPPGATLIPHPPVVWEQIRAFDMIFLLALGALSELLFRLCVLFVKRKPTSLRRKEDYFFKLQFDTKEKQKLGPAAFVETSKLERQLLALDKELKQMYQDRQATREKVEKILLKYGRNAMAFLIFIVYYGVPIISFSGGDMGGLDQLDDKIPATFHKAVMFPLSFVGFGYKLSKWGMDEESVATSLGALVVLWAGSGFVGQICDGAEHLLLS